MRVTEAELEQFAVRVNKNFNHPDRKKALEDFDKAKHFVAMMPWKNGRINVRRIHKNSRERLLRETLIRLCSILAALGFFQKANEILQLVP